MHLHRLSWAGVVATEGPASLLLDPLEDVAPLAGFLGAPRGSLVPVAADAQTWALVTHLHLDHCDRRLLARLPAGQVICHAPIQPALAAEGVRARPVDLWDTIEAGPFRVTAVPSHDWRGDDQVAWVLEGGGRRVIHCGDTIWHGGWYAIARHHGPFDVAFLPISGVIARLDGFTATEVPATLTPEQAVEAAVVLGARAACAIHHALFHNPPKYVEQPRAVERFLAAAARRGVSAVAPAAGAAVPSAP
jgi:L-ascorbate metabolism protein UlaG (beta-lactamase superfamily)